MKTKHLIHPFPYGESVDLVKVVSVKNSYNGMFFLGVDGRVYNGRTYGQSVRSLADRERRAYCALTGVKYAELKAEFAKHDAREMAKQRKRDIESLRSRAAYLGYKIVKVKTP